jgi:hypothetical protein
MIMNTQRGLDGRDRDENGEIRLKNGATKAKTLAKEDPLFKAFSPESTLTNLRKRYKVQSEKDLRKVAITKLKAKKYGGVTVAR